MHHSHFILGGLFIMSIIVSGCSSEYNPFGTELRRVTPEHEAVLNESGCFTVSGTDGTTFYMPAAAYDSILVMSLMGAENHIAAVNVNNGRIIGNYITNGTKEDMMTSFFSECQYKVHDGNLILYPEDFETGQCYIFDITDAVSSGKPSLIRKGKHEPLSTVSCLNDSVSLVSLISDDGKAMIETVDFRGNVLSNVVLFPDSDASMQKTFLSNRVLPDYSGTRAAVAMTFLPQLNIIDLISGKRQSVLYGNTDLELLADRFKETGQYPDDTFASRLFTTDELIYIVRTHYAETDDDSDYTELLIFDWSGSFKYRMKIENIFTGTALDAGNNILYGGEGMSTVHVYDFSSRL